MILKNMIQNIQWHPISQCHRAMALVVFLPRPEIWGIFWVPGNKKSQSPEVALVDFRPDGRPWIFQIYLYPEFKFIDLILSSPYQQFGQLSCQSTRLCMGHSNGASSSLSNALLSFRIFFQKICLYYLLFIFYYFNNNSYSIAIILYYFR